MKKKVISLLLATALAGISLAGCGAEEGAATQQPAAAGTEAADTASEEPAQTAGAGEEEAAAEAEAEEFDEEDITEIELYNIDLTGGSDITAVAEAVNEISEKEIGVHVNFNLADFSSYLDQTGMNLAGNETMDLIVYTPAPPINFSAMTSLGQLMDIKDLVDEYGADIKADLGDYLKGTELGDSLYGVTTHSEFATDLYIVMREDVLKELNLLEKAEKMETWTEFEEILAAVTEANQAGTLPEELKTTAAICNGTNGGEIFPRGGIMCGSDKFSENYAIDPLGDNYGFVSSDSSTDAVSNYYTSEDYYKTLQRVNDWNKKGYIYKDAAITDQSADTLMQNGVTFSFLALGNYGLEENRESLTGHELFTRKIVSVPVGSNVCQTWGMAVPVTAQDPESAVKFINLMYSNADVMNLLTWGIEGTDYKLNDEGEAVKIENSPYTGFGFLWGNSTLTYPAEGSGADFYEKAREVDENAEISKYMGFVVDSADYANELTAINNVITQYQANLESGMSVDLDKDYAEFTNSLESAGVNTVLDGYQEQLNAWLAQ